MEFWGRLTLQAQKVHHCFGTVKNNWQRSGFWNALLAQTQHLGECCDGYKNI
jgi:hypothetical protein